MSEESKEFDEETYLKSLDKELENTKKFIKESQKLILELKQNNKLIESDVSDDMKKAYNASLEIEKERHEETMYYNSLSPKDKEVYLKNNRKIVADYYKENNIPTVGENITDEDFDY